LKIMQTIFTLAGVGLAIYLVVALGLFVIQRRLIYHPDAAYHTPAAADLNGVQEVRLETPDGERLICWWAPAAANRPTLLYFQGNAGGLIDRAPRVERFANAGYGVFMPAYRGYSGSTGSPSEKALIADAMLAYDHLRGLGIAPRDIVVYGESLGSGVAVQLAAARPVGVLVLDAPYTSLPDIGKSIYPFLPVDTFMVDRFESKRHVAKVEAPILILHGGMDTTSPLDHGRALYHAAPEPKELVVVEEAGHSNIAQYGAFAPLQRFIEKHRGAAARQPVGG
jgi:fermentation-respiration switch protein FrsA (DUF1100 family)